MAVLRKSEYRSRRARRDESEWAENTKGVNDSDEEVKFDAVEATKCSSKMAWASAPPKPIQSKLELEVTFNGDRVRLRVSTLWY